eukprot:Tbor_TRINITY_DN9168_c0_g1::TRINITY_DN9168_c0_g1_i1::g.14498::m.14498
MNDGTPLQSTQNQPISNQEHDEVYTISDERTVESPDELPLEIQCHRPRNQQRQSSTRACSSSNNQQNRKTQMKHSGRTIIRGPSHKLLSNSLIDIFQYVDAYTPRDIELPMKFMFPGSLGYTPAVHVPDPILSPPLPIKLPKQKMNPISSPSTAATPTGSHSGQENSTGTTGSGMFWSFFDTVVSPRNTPRSSQACSTSEIPSSANTTGNQNIPQTTRVPTTTVHISSNSNCNS